MDKQQYQQQIREEITKLYNEKQFTNTCPYCNKRIWFTYEIDKRKHCTHCNKPIVKRNNRYYKKEIKK